MPDISQVVETAKNYYNSNDADSFYFTIWGGEDIHIGMYQSPQEPIYDASRRTVRTMAQRLNGLGPGSKVLDLGSGFGGAARWLAKNKGFKVCALNLSDVENERNRCMCRDQGVDSLVEVVDGSFENIPFPDAAFDAVWSQDAILHSGAREKVVREAARVLKPGGHFVFTDPMASDDCPEGVLQPILDRIHLDTLACPAFYRGAAQKNGLEEVSFEEATPQLVTHYARVLEETKKKEDELGKTVSRSYIENMKKGLGHWVNGGEKGHLAWGIFHFQKS